MFNTQIEISTFIYILIFAGLLIVAFIQLINVWKKRDRNYYLNFCALLFSGIIYNLVEGLLPDHQFGIDILAQNILAFTVGLVVAFHYLFYLKKIYNLKFYEKISFASIGMAACMALIVLFILPYTVTKSLEVSRVFFLGFFFIVLLLMIIVVIKDQTKKIKEEKSAVLKIHYFIGIIGFLGLLSLPFNILIFGDNQVIEQSSFSIGFLFLTVDFFLYGLRKKELKKNIPIAELSARENEILKILLENPELKYAEISERLNISEKTLSTHLNKIYKKIGIKSKKEINEMSKSMRESIIF